MITPESPFSEPSPTSSLGQSSENETPTDKKTDKIFEAKIETQAEEPTSASFEFKAFLVTKYNDILSAIAKVFQNFMEKLFGPPEVEVESRDYSGTWRGSVYVSGVEKEVLENGNIIVRFYKEGKLEPPVNNGEKKIYFKDRECLQIEKEGAFFHHSNGDISKGTFKDGIFTPESLISCSSISEIIQTAMKPTELPLINTDLMSLDRTKESIKIQEKEICGLFSLDFRRKARLEISDQKRGPKVFSPSTPPEWEEIEKQKQKLNSQPIPPEELTNKIKFLDEKLKTPTETYVLDSYQCLEDSVNFSKNESDKKWLVILQNAATQKTKESLLRDVKIRANGILAQEELQLKASSISSPVHFDIHRKEDGQIDYVDVTWKGSLDLASETKKVLSEEVVSGQIKYAISFDNEGKLQVKLDNENSFLVNNLASKTRM